MNEAGLILNLAPTGMVPTKQMTPNVPLSVEEVVSDVEKCTSLGVNMVHLHARDATGAPTSDPSVYGQLVSDVRERCSDLVVVCSTSGRIVGDVDSRAAPLRLTGKQKPDMASLTLGSMNFFSTASVNSPTTIQRLAEIMKENGIKPELEVFDLGMVNYAHYLIDRGILEPPFYFNIILGNVASAQASFSHLGAIVSGLPDESVWSLGGIGKFQQSMNHVAIAMADGLRVGLEDNIWFDQQRTILATNMSLVERLVSNCRLTGRSIATPLEVRSRLGLRIVSDAT